MILFPSCCYVNQQAFCCFSALLKNKRFARQQKRTIICGGSESPQNYSGWVLPARNSPPPPTQLVRKKEKQKKKTPEQCSRHQSVCSLFPASEIPVLMFCGSNPRIVLHRTPHKAQSAMLLPPPQTTQAQDRDFLLRPVSILVKITLHPKRIFTCSMVTKCFCGRPRVARCWSCHPGLLSPSHLAYC